MIKKYTKLMLLIILLAFSLIACRKDENNDNSDTGGVGVTEESEEETTEDIEVTVNDYKVDIKKGNSWEVDGDSASQFDGILYNNSNEDISDWKLTFDVPEGSRIESSWNGEYVIEDNNLTITPVDYNINIMASANITFGFILVTPDSTYEVKDVAINIMGVDYSNNKDVAKNTDKKEETTTEETVSNNAPKDITGTPVANHGKLMVDGVNIVDKNGDKYQLKGVSTHGINWFPEYVNKDAFQTFRDDWGANVIRLAMYTADYNGYCSGGSQSELKGIVNNGVDYATELGMYVIIDWHILNDNNPQTNKGDAIKFFDEMSKKYANYDNVIYEICNEPNGGTSWSDIKSYAEEVIPVIKANNTDAIIIVGTPNWSQDVDIASKDQIAGYNNIMYAVHFYASTHKDDIRNKVTTALNNGAPIFVSECSICDASGNGSIDYNEADKWIKLINDKNLSFACWNISNKDESSSLISSGCSKKSGWSDSDYSETGKWFKEQISK